MSAGDPLPPPWPGDAYLRRTCRGQIHWGGFRDGVLLTDCLLDLAEGVRWMHRGGLDEVW